MELVETLNRTMKLALDDGRVNSYEEAQTLFNSFKLRIHVHPGFSMVPAAQAAVLTLLAAAPRTFLGGVELVGPFDERCTMAWFPGTTLGHVAEQFGVAIAPIGPSNRPTIYLGDGVRVDEAFWLGLSLQRDGFILSPERSAIGSPDSSVDAGVAAAGAALSEAFQHVYRKAPLAGQREVHWRLPLDTTSRGVESVWVIGLGHLGQAFLWTVALASELPPAIRLSDYDAVSWSSLSTCLLIKAKDVGRKKVDVLADLLQSLGVVVHRDYQRVDLDAGVVRPEEELAVIAVDNIALRRSLDRLQAKRVFEAGIGDGTNAFTRIQMHAFPGPRRARDIWVGDDARAARSVDLSKPAYQTLLAKTGDECGTALVAGHAVATPFVGAFAGAVLHTLVRGRGDGEFAWNFDLANL
jgi:hypothetical protein